VKELISLLIPPLKIQQLPIHNNLPGCHVTPSLLLIIISKEIQYVIGEPPFGQSLPLIDRVSAIYPFRNDIALSRAKSFGN
jgi:hypothetical protein